MTQTGRPTFRLALASRDDVDSIHTLTVRSALGNPPDWFIMTDAPTIARQMRSGFTVAAYAGLSMAGILHVHFPNAHESHARQAAANDPTETVAHMDIAAVLPEHRGWGLMGHLLAAAEIELRQQHPDRVACYATVHPDNTPSRRTFESAGYRATARLVLHEHFPRLLFRKTLTGAVPATGALTKIGALR